MRRKGKKKQERDERRSNNDGEILPSVQPVKLE
jgi:hypothetical protein